VDNSPIGAAVNMFAGWFLPTTLTAGRGYGGTGSLGNNSLRVHTTTSEFHVNVDRTTDDVWTSSGAGMVTGVWQFVAYVLSVSSAGETDLALWRGTLDDRPVEVSMSRSVGSGFVASSSTGVAGNIGSTASAAFQGQAENIVYMRSALSAGIENLFSLESEAVITADERQFLLQRFILPIWAGEVPCLLFRQRTVSSAQWMASLALVFNEGRAKQIGVRNVALNAAATVDGATFSETRGPRPKLQHLHPYPARIRR
jgi:hypothetical protein